MTRGLVSLVLLFASAAAAQPTRGTAHAELLLGTAWSLPTPLVIRLPGSPELRLRGRYATRPWSDAPYYAYRAGGPVELEELHHKLYLEHPLPPVEHFEISHGYNLATTNVLADTRRLTARVGIGLVIAHAEGSVAGERVGGTRRTFLGGGYHVAGATLQLAVGRRWALTRGGSAVLYATPEGALTASLASVPVGDAGGRAFVPNVALHALGGVGVARRERAK